MRRNVDRLVQMLGYLIVDPVRMHAVRRENKYPVDLAFAVEPCCLVDAGFGFAAVPCEKHPLVATCYKKSRRNLEAVGFAVQ